MADVGLRLLSLDGGGVKGLSSLYQLRALMHRVRVRDNLEHIPRPCDYFDLIGGTSTGGLVALMLGRLGMDIDSCIAAYSELAQEVFGKTRRGKVRRACNLMSQGSMYSAEKLETAIKKVIRGALGAEPDDIPLRGSEDTGCKVFVCTMNCANSTLQLLRSYQSNEPQDEYKMWEAARATSAAPFYFKQMKMSHSAFTFSDGGMLRNNPIETVYHEARQIWPSRDISIVISIGTGVVETSGLKNKFRSMIDVTIKALVDAQAQAQAFERSTDGRDLIDRGSYFRFNVEQGLQKTRMDDASEKTMAKLQAHTETYLRCDNVNMLVDRCVQRLCDLKRAADAPAAPEIDLPAPPEKQSAAATGSETIPLRFMRTFWEHVEQGLPAGRSSSRPVTPGPPLLAGPDQGYVPFYTRWKIMA